MIVFDIDKAGEIVLRLQCDYCGKPIAGHSFATVMPIADRFPSQAVIVCKGACRDAVAMRVGKTRAGERPVNNTLAELAVAIGLRQWMASRMTDPLFMR
jgi:hypothetical protein